MGIMNADLLDALKRADDAHRAEGFRRSESDLHRDQIWAGAGPYAVGPVLVRPHDKLPFDYCEEFRVLI